MNMPLSKVFDHITSNLRYHDFYKIETTLAAASLGKCGYGNGIAVMERISGTVLIVSSETVSYTHLTLPTSDLV